MPTRHGKRRSQWPTTGGWRAGSVHFGLRAAATRPRRCRARGPRPRSSADPGEVRALALLGDRRVWDRARLASEAAEDPHALDDGRPAAALLLAALAFRDGVE